MKMILEKFKETKK